jgi:hypothetical protein
MSTAPDHARELARRIASRLEANKAAPAGIAPSDVAGLRDLLAQVSRRLDQIESTIAPVGATAPTGAYSPWAPPAAAHASLEKFDVEEAAVAEMVDYFESAKKCDLEPGGKPCDHCSMCSSRGF